MNAINLSPIGAAVAAVKGKEKLDWTPINLSGDDEVRWNAIVNDRAAFLLMLKGRVEAHLDAHKIAIPKGHRVVMGDKYAKPSFALSARQGKVALDL